MGENFLDQMVNHWSGQTVNYSVQTVNQFSDQMVNQWVLMVNQLLFYQKASNWVQMANPFWDRTVNQSWPVVKTRSLLPMLVVLDPQWPILISKLIQKRWQDVRLNKKKEERL